MFLKKNRGNIVAQFTVLLIIAVIMITIVSFFGVRVMSIFFPDPDKSSLQSFEMVNIVINGVMTSNFEYESETLGIYMAKNYEMVLFYEPTLKCNNDVYYTPKDCGNLKCICLYDDDPVKNKERKRDKNVVKCHTFKEDVHKININPKYFNLNDGVCSRDSSKKYSSLIIAKRKAPETVAPEEKGKEYLYIMNDIEANRQLDSGWSINRCSPEPGNINGICSDKTGNSIFIPSTDDEASQILEHCKVSENVPYKSTHVFCELQKTGNCVVKCADGDVTKKCHATGGYNFCSDFNRDRGVNNEKYVDLANNFESYWMCARDADYCDLGCEISSWKTYTCKNSNNGAATGTSCTLPSDCGAKFLADTGVLKDFLQSYDDSKQECIDFVDQNFFKDNIILECKASDIECKSFVLNKRAECSLKYINDGDIYWITYYDSGCDLEVKKLFDTARFCMDKPSNP